MMPVKKFQNRRIHPTTLPALFFRQSIFDLPHLIFSEIGIMLFLWIKAFHIIALVAWFAGIFYIWRLFVYHAESTSEDMRQTLIIMERRLYFAIMMPAMIVTLGLGFCLLYLSWESYHASGWIWTKIGLVFILLINHFMADYYRRKLLEGRRYRSKIFRILNEMPTILLIAIVILVVIKPY
jgi:protoporphyrinogen IX oxidase